MNLTTGEEKKILNDITNFKYLSYFFKDWISEDFNDAICEIFKKGGYVSVSRKTEANIRIWDGNLTIHFGEKPSAQEVVKLIAKSKCDEFGMTDEKTLWFWFD